MQKLEIKAQKRDEFGTSSAKDIRKAGMVPCVMYGGGETIHFSVKNLELRPLIYTDKSYIVALDLDGEKYNCVLRQLQFHPVTDEPIHIDFYRVVPGKPVEIDIPVQLIGTPAGVKSGGKLFLGKRRLRVSALEEHLPDAIQHDITRLVLNGTVFVSDINIENIKILTPGSTVVCAVKMTRAAMGGASAADDEHMDEESAEGGEDTAASEE